MKNQDIETVKFSREAMGDEPLFELIDEQLNEFVLLTKEIVDAYEADDKQRDAEMKPVYRLMNTARLILFTRVEAEINKYEKLLNKEAV